MKEIVSKFSLYDILAMVIPGGAILLAIALMINNLLIINTNIIEKPLFWIVGMTGAYLVGLLNHTFTSVVWGKFRNNELMIKLSIENARRYLPDNGRFDRLTNKINTSDIDKNIVRNCICLLKSVLPTCMIFIALIFTMYLCYKCESEDVSLVITIPFIAILICVISELIYTLNGGRTYDSDIIQKYYSAYYFVVKHKYSDDISIMEGQIAFLQSMVLPLILFLFSDTCLLEDFIPGICIGLMHALLLIIIVTVFFAVFCRQMKIYRRVWEDYEYLHQCNEDSDNLNVLNNKKITISNS